MQAQANYAMVAPLNIAAQQVPQVAEPARQGCLSRLITGCVAPTHNRINQTRMLHWLNDSRGFAATLTLPALGTCLSAIGVITGNNKVAISGAAFAGISLPLVLYSGLHQPVATTEAFAAILNICRAIANRPELGIEFDVNQLARFTTECCDHYNELGSVQVDQNYQGPPNLGPEGTLVNRIELAEQTMQQLGERTNTLEAINQENEEAITSRINNLERSTRELREVVIGYSYEGEQYFNPSESQIEEQ